MTVSDHVECARELAGLRRELESVTADRVQLEALYATSRDEVLSLREQVHDLNNRLTAVTLERDALRGLLESPKHVFTPESGDGTILSITTFRGTVLVACEYALYQLTPCEGPIEWTIEKISQGSQIPHGVIRW